jgi:hypothetical protein
MPNESKNISITIPEHMYTWLEEHKEINRSALFRKAIEATMNKQKVSSLMFLVSIMGIAFSVALIGIGVTESPINIFVRGIMMLLGGFLAIATMFLYYRERKQIFKAAVNS